MNILAVDTASNSCSVAVVSEQKVLSEISVVTRETHSKHLMGMIESAVLRSGIPKHELDGYAVTQGPGSFTGLRIGISTLRGFSEATGKPIVGVSSLDALAASFFFSAIPVCTMLDARRGEVYFAWYSFEDGTMKRETAEDVAPPASVLFNRNGPCLFVGDGSEAYREIIAGQNTKKVFFSRPSQNSIRAAHVGYLGIEKLQRQDRLDAQLIPRYIRKCDAERKREERVTA